MRGNKGEWSEAYVFLKLLTDGVLYPGDIFHNKIEGLHYPIVEIERDDKGGSPVRYIVSSSGFYTPSGEFFTREMGHQEVAYLLNEIRHMDRTQSIERSEKFLNSLGCTRLKASSLSKADIRIVVHDHRTGLNPMLGFSIKSYLGNAPTLLNASKATNFRFKLSQTLSLSEIDEINRLSPSVGKIQKRLEAIEQKNRMLIFDDIDNTIFRNNLTLIDTSLPLILAKLLLLYYTGRGSKLSELVTILEQENPLDFDQRGGHCYYTYKIKKFLVEIALGLLPSKHWSGTYDATGGYIVVKEDGDIVSYHFYDKNYFEDYLFYNTKLDTPSSTRNDFGYLTDTSIFRLNLQLRFI